ncbi:hypothetical protein [Ferrimonas lipolytica]|uniref:Decaheme cytochrome c component MtrC/MtrF domain-containing protein n=1 Tax=Ferrimonas lipolytica TaxID=2724191 RepID=A0A6H1UIU4_9GAMM|nr:hypothetical protein [Ferrimonas lipolytica]QIZ78136.1 hypothetical protein HER31_15235 [Ferrimonas lipolytica]
MMTFAVNRITAILASTLLLGLVGCSDGDDGKDGAPGAPGIPGDAAPLVTDEAKTVDVEITASTVVDGRLTIEFAAYNELALPLVRIDGLKVQAAQLQAENEGERSQWQVLGYEKCKVDSCAGELEDRNDGTYRYTFSGAVDSAYDLTLPQRSLFGQFLTLRFGSPMTVVG